MWPIQFKLMKLQGDQFFNSELLHNPDLKKCSHSKSQKEGNISALLPQFTSFSTEKLKIYIQYVKHF